MEELDLILGHPYAKEILLSDWLHSGELPIPSVQMVQHFARRILDGHGISIEAGGLDRDRIATRVIEALREETAEARLASVKATLNSLRATQLEFSGREKTSSPHLYEWLPVVDRFLYPTNPWEDQESNALVLAGQRSLARGVLESLMLRAVFHFDVARIEGLRQALEIIRDKRDVTPLNAHQIAAQIIRCRVYLETRLGRSPSKTEFKTFLLGIHPDTLTDHANTWTEAFRLLGFPTGNDRKRLIDGDQITRLVLEIQARENR